jgi:hypothetical protein
MFAREHELVSELAAHHRQLWPAMHSRRIKAERGYGRGVADLIVLDFDSLARAGRLSADLPALPNAGQAYIVGALRGLGPTPIAACGRLDPNIGERTNLHTLRRLVADGYVVQEGAVVEVHPAMMSPVRRIVAIEAKLADWRGGLLQAARYRAFADQSYLAMPMATAQRLVANHADVARALGVGVIGVGLSTRILLGAQRAAPAEPGVRVWAEESEYSDVLGSPRRLVSPFPPRFAVPTPDQLVAAGS